MNRIYVLENHHNNKPTAVVGEFCINGCQVFHRVEAEKIFEKFGVNDLHRQDVINLFDKYNPNKLFDLDDLKNHHEQFESCVGNLSENCDEMKYIIMYCDIFTILAEKYKTPELIDIMFNSEDYNMILFGMKYFSTEQKEQLVLSKSGKIREIMASLGDKKHLDILVGDEYKGVRQEVAKHGHKEHLDILVNDKSDWVRSVVAKHGHKEHLDNLVE